MFLTYRQKREKIKFQRPVAASMVAGPPGGRQASTGVFSTGSTTGTGPSSRFSGRPGLAGHQEEHDREQGEPHRREPARELGLPAADRAASGAAKRPPL